MTPCFKPTLAEIKSYVYNIISIADDSQTPIFFNDNSCRQSVWWDKDDDTDTDYDNYSFKQLRNLPKILGCTYQKACQANNCTILPTKIHTSSPDKCTSIFLDQHHHWIILNTNSVRPFLRAPYPIPTLTTIGSMP